MGQVQPTVRFILYIVMKVLMSENSQGSKGSLTVLRPVHVGMVS